MSNSDILQFAPYSSFVHATFWHKLAETKIDLDKLSDAPRPIHGFFSNKDSLKSLVEVEYTAFNKTFVPPNNSFKCRGTLYNKNTIEEFRECDKLDLMKVEGAKVWRSIVSYDWIDDPSRLLPFFILSFAELKKFNFYYCFGFPAPVYGNSIVLQREVPLDIEKIANVLQHISEENQLFFILNEEEPSNILTYHSLGTFISKHNISSNFATENLEKIYFCFADSSEDRNPGWMLRLYLAALLKSSPMLMGKKVNVISLKKDKAGTFNNSHCFRVQLTSEPLQEEQLQWIGWELNSKGKFAPKMAPMADSMDPKILAETSTNLNLKLMKWRLLPELDLETIASLKCLLLGAGTLGCGVARNLLSWGIKHITFVDYGQVSYSNPVRQNLFRHEDAVNGRAKAQTAAERIKEIHPGVVSDGFSIHIPMPGHTIGDSMLDKCKTDFVQLENLIQAHDVIFLLTDSRESRWLPTLIGCCYDKLVMNAALGFDSYLVMRHGSRITKEPNAVVAGTSGLKCIDGNELGCYFCNDVVAPRNSLKDRTLDQQCTVTRPAVSNIASSLVVELMVAVVQHPLRQLAPAYVKNAKANELSEIPEGILGIVPHSVRGMVSTFEQVLPAVERFSKCIACSEIVLNEFRRCGFEFALSAFNSSKYLEDITGITEMLHNEQHNIIECDEDDFDDLSD